MRGARSARPTLILHLAEGSQAGVPRIGFIVSKAVGNSVTRHRVVRRLRHAAKNVLPLLANNSLLVVRARPSSALATSDVLADDLSQAIDKLLGRTAVRT